MPHTHRPLEYIARFRRRNIYLSALSACGIRVQQKTLRVQEMTETSLLPEASEMKRLEGPIHLGARIPDFLGLQEVQSGRPR